MHKINLKKPLLMLNGSPALNNGEQILLSTTIADLISSGAGANSLKVFEQCKSLYTTGELNLDTTDLDEFKKLVDSNQNATILLKGQVLQEIAKQVK